MHNDTITDAADDGNVPDEVNPAEERRPTISENIEPILSDPTNETAVNALVEATEEIDPIAELPVAELPVAELLVKELPGANVLLANNARDFTQRRISIRYAINDNPDRGSRNLPEPKHLVIKLPDALARLFSGVWVAEQGEEVFIDLFARNDQDDRRGHRDDDPWRWIKIKENGEIAMGISRPYTKSRSEGELVRDYKIGAFKLAVPLAACAGAPELVAGDRPTFRRLFG